MEKKSIINVDGRFYYGWVMLICGFMTMFICYVIKANCTSLFYTPICEELGVTRTVYTQTNTVLTICMLIGSSFIGKIYKKYPVKYVLTGCVGLASRYVAVLITVRYPGLCMGWRNQPSCRYHDQ